MVVAGLFFAPHAGRIEGDGHIAQAREDLRGHLVALPGLGAVPDGNHHRGPRRRKRLRNRQVHRGIDVPAGQRLEQDILDDVLRLLVARHGAHVEFRAAGAETNLAEVVAHAVPDIVAPGLPRAAIDRGGAAFRGAVKRLATALHEMFAKHGAQLDLRGHRPQGELPGRGGPGPLRRVRGGHRRGHRHNRLHQQCSTHGKTPFQTATTATGTPHQNTRDVNRRDNTNVPATRTISRTL